MTGNISILIDENLFVSIDGELSKEEMIMIKAKITKSLVNVIYEVIPIGRVLKISQKLSK